VPEVPVQDEQPGSDDPTHRQDQARAGNLCEEGVQGSPQHQEQEEGLDSLFNVLRRPTRPAFQFPAAKLTIAFAISVSVARSSSVNPGFEFTSKTSGPRFDRIISIPIISKSNTLAV